VLRLLIHQVAPAERDVGGFHDDVELGNGPREVDDLRDARDLVAVFVESDRRQLARRQICANVEPRLPRRRLHDCHFASAEYDADALHRSRDFEDQRLRPRHDSEEECEEDDLRHG
jgi:hypothetical protein